VMVYDAWRTGFLKRTAADERRIHDMITESDNPAANELIDRLGMSQIRSWLLTNGYERIEVRHRLLAAQPDGPNVVTATEMTRMLLQIARLEAVSAEASREMRRVLLEQTRRTRIPAGLPEGVTVGNKTGTLNGIVNDVAFVETPQGLRYTIAVLVDRAGGDAPTSRAIARLSRLVYEHLTEGSGH
jgi:beta-lactamase class A